MPPDLCALCVSYARLAVKSFSLRPLRPFSAPSAFKAFPLCPFVSFCSAKSSPTTSDRRLTTVLEQSRRRSHPLHVPVVIHAHHQPAAHPQDRQHRAQLVHPEVHHPHFHLGPAKRRRNHRLKVQPLLQNVL